MCVAELVDFSPDLLSVIVTKQYIHQALQYSTIYYLPVLVMSSTEQEPSLLLPDSASGYDYIEADDVNTNNTPSSYKEPPAIVAKSIADFECPMGYSLYRVSKNHTSNIYRWGVRVKSEEPHLSNGWFCCASHECREKPAFIRIVSNTSNVMLHLKSVHDVSSQKTAVMPAERKRARSDRNEKRSPAKFLMHSSALTYVKFIAEQLVPMSIGHSETFQAFFKDSFKDVMSYLPKHITDVYMSTKQVLLDELNLEKLEGKIPLFHLQFEVWNSNFPSIHHVACRVQYVTSKFEQKNHILGFRRFQIHKNGSSKAITEVLLKFYREVLYEFHIAKDEVGSCTVDFKMNQLEEFDWPGNWELSICQKLDISLYEAFRHEECTCVIDQLVEYASGLLGSDFPELKCLAPDVLEHLKRCTNRDALYLNINPYVCWASFIVVSDAVLMHCWAGKDFETSRKKLVELKLLTVPIVELMEFARKAEYPCSSTLIVKLAYLKNELPIVSLMNETRKYLAQNIEKYCLKNNQNLQVFHQNAALNLAFKSLKYMAKIVSLDEVDSTIENVWDAIRQFGEILIKTAEIDLNSTTELENNSDEIQNLNIDFPLKRGLDMPPTSPGGNQDLSTFPPENENDKVPKRIFSVFHRGSVNLSVEDIVDAEIAMFRDDEKVKEVPFSDMLVYWRDSREKYPVLSKIAQAMMGHYFAPRNKTKSFQFNGLLSDDFPRDPSDVQNIEMLLFLHSNFEYIPDCVGKQVRNGTDRVLMRRGGASSRVSI